MSAVKDGKTARKPDAANSGLSAPKRVIGKPFQKGQSGNPNGRPKVVAEVQELARAQTERAIMVLAEALDDPDGRVRIAAANALLDRGYGKPAQAITGENGGPIVFGALSNDQLAAEVAKLVATDPEAASIFAPQKERPS